MFRLQVEQLSKNYNRHKVFDNLSFSHSKGVLGISGANGSGKSTLLKCLAFLLRPKTGTILWSKDEVNYSKENSKTLMGYSAPYINLYDELTLIENLRFLKTVSGLSNDVAPILSLLEYVEIDKLGDHLFKNLSTGQQQRAKLAASLVRNPEILFLDEPGSNLDTKGHALVENIVKDQNEAGTFVVIASNDPEEIKLCDQVIQLHD
ncbi:MAG: ABC transporter ATP-binding protein [Balneola sp.]|nr:MAG: ABC transporter ATP-binding protein [Balneola sp.]